MASHNTAQKQFSQFVRPCSLSCEMLKDVFWSSACHSGKPSLLLITFSHFRSYTVHWMTDVQEGKRSSSNTTMHSPTQLVCAWRGCRTSRNVSISHPYGPDLGLPSIKVCKGSDGKSALCDQQGSPGAVCCLRTTENEFYLKRIFKLRQQWQKCAIRMVFHKVNTVDRRDRHVAVSKSYLWFWN